MPGTHYIERRTSGLLFLPFLAVLEVLTPLTGQFGSRRVFSCFLWYPAVLDCLGLCHILQYSRSSRLLKCFTFKS